MERCRAAWFASGPVMVAFVRLALYLLLIGGTIHAREKRVVALQAEGQQGTGRANGRRRGRVRRVPRPTRQVFDFLDPGQYLRRFDQLLGLEVDQSGKPRGPELPLAVFVQSNCLLASLKYENQLNYFESGFTGAAPVFQ